MDQETRLKLLTQLLENPENLTEEQREQISHQLMQEINNVKDPKIKQKLLTDMLANVKDLPPEAMSQLLSNISDLPPSQQKELLKQILEKFDELPPEAKAKLVDDLLNSAAGNTIPLRSQSSFTLL